MPAAVPVPPPRALRAGLAAGLAVVAAVLAHSAGHSPVDLAGAAWAFAGLVGPAWWLARRERGWGAIALTQLAGQQVAHLALSMSAADTAHLVGTDLMLYAHLVAAAAAGGWLRWGERRAWAAVCRILPVLLPAPLPLDEERRSLPLPAAPARGLSVPLLRHAVARRGPPPLPA